MCGVAGILGVGKISLETLVSMTKVIAHRGPDGDGHWINADGNIGFGHRRLAIIDLSENGKQPMHYGESRYTITFNGEIYNYIELREDLIAKGYTFFSDSDTEVLLALYDCFKEKCLDLLDGMFAFAIWDEKEKKLFCARDRFGEKPFYFYKDKERFIFASEIKQFWMIGIERELNPDKVSEFLNKCEVLNDTELEKTFYKNITSLKAAHYLICEKGLEITIKNYWNLDHIRINKNITFPEAIKEFTRLFDQSLKNRLRSDVPVGSSLSGGLDSSCIVYSVNKKFLQPNQQQFTFSARFNNYEKDEGEYIGALIDEMPEIKRSDVFLDKEEFEKEIEKIIYHQDEPFQSASIFAQFKVMQLARKNGVTVLLDGQGADELLGGYETLYIDYLKQSFYNAPKVYRKDVVDYNKLHAGKYGLLDLRKQDTIYLKLNRRVKTFLNKEQAIPDNYFFEILKSYITGRQLQQLLRYADRNSMANSIETRLPFLYHKLVEFVFTLPDSFKMQGGWPKYILRKAFEHQITDKIIWRQNKVGFETPESDFLKSEKAKIKIAHSKQYIKDNKISSDPETVNPWQLYMLSSFSD